MDNSMKHDFHGKPSVTGIITHSHFLEADPAFIREQTRCRSKQFDSTTNANGDAS
jgi:hypothetical protein